MGSVLGSCKWKWITTGRWSDISLYTIAVANSYNKLFTKMLSIKLAECSVILVGWMIVGTKDWEMKIPYFIKLW